MNSQVNESYANDAIIDYYKNTIRFLDLIFGNRAFEIRMIEEGSNAKNPVSRSYLINNNDVYVWNKQWINKYKKMYGNIWEYLVYHDYWTKRGCYSFNDFGFFFIPNSPDFDEIERCTLKDNDIKYINCQFIDIDAPEEIRKDKMMLEDWKKEQYKKVEQWIYPPSIVVKSKNGLHCYWLLNDGKKELFRCIQLQLASYFGGDTQCQNPSRAIRLPYFMHRKDRHNPYLVLIMKMHDIRYTQEQLSTALPQLSAKIVKESAKKQREKSPVIHLDPGQEKRLWRLVRSHIEVSSETKEKIVCRCPMPEHEDKHPSAWIDKEYQWFHCASGHCGVTLPLEELVEELDWEDVLEELSRPKYQIEIINDYKGLIEHMIQATNCPELELNRFENEIVGKIYEKIISIFESRNQFLNDKHKQYIRVIVKILYKSDKSIIPDLIPLDIGGGKSTIIETFIIEMVKINSNYGVILVKERIEDVVNASKNINECFTENVAYPMYGFQEKECKKNLGKCESVYRKNRYGGLYPYCKCEHKKECRYYNQSKEQQKYPVLIITHDRLFDEVRNDTFTVKYRLFNKVYVREKLICDEKPKMIYDSDLTEWQFAKYSQAILKRLLSINDEAYKEFQDSLNLISPLFMIQDNIDIQARESILPIDPNFSFSKNFWVEFGSMIHYKEEYHKFPETIENLIKYGGHRSFNKKHSNIWIKINTSHYCVYTYGNQFHSIIFDGTADIDFSYIHKKYRIFHFEPLRQYTEFFFYECNYLKSTKTELSKDNVLGAFIEQVKLIVKQNSGSKIYLPVYKDHEPMIREGLREYIDQDIIKVAHYNSTKGSNDFRECDIVIIQSFLHKTEDYYIDIHRAITNKYLDDLSATPYDGLRRFNNKEIEHFKITDQNVDYTQEIKRTIQRDQTRDIPGKVYLFTNDTYLLEVLKWKFPGCQAIKWNPERLLEDKIVNNDHKQAKNEKLIYGYFMQNQAAEKIALKDVVESTGLDKSTVSQVLGKPTIKGIIKNLGFKKEREWKEVYFIRSTVL